MRATRGGTTRTDTVRLTLSAPTTICVSPGEIALTQPVADTAATRSLADRQVIRAPDTLRRSPPSACATRRTESPGSMSGSAPVGDRFSAATPVGPDAASCRALASGGEGGGSVGVESFPVDAAESLDG